MIASSSPKGCRIRGLDRARNEALSLKRESWIRKLGNVTILFETHCKMFRDDQSVDRWRKKCIAESIFLKLVCGTREVKKSDSWESFFFLFPSPSNKGRPVVGKKRVSRFPPALVELGRNPVLSGTLSRSWLACLETRMHIRVSARVYSKRSARV